MAALTPVYRAAVQHGLDAFLAAEPDQTDE
jgi:hypothetical protein